MKKIFVAMAVLGTVLLSSCVREKEFHNKNIKMGENEIAFVMKDVTTRSADEAAPARKAAPAAPAQPAQMNAVFRFIVQFPSLSENSTAMHTVRLP